MSDRTFVDTNVFVYAVDNSEPAKQSRARQVLSDRQELVISAQVLSEFFATVTRKLAIPLRYASAVAAVERLAALPAVPVDAELVGSGISISHDAQLSYWDGLIVAAAQASGCERLLSEDLSDGQVIAGVVVENPFG